VNAVSADFRKRFDEGLKAYLNGKWADAKLQYLFKLILVLHMHKKSVATTVQQNDF
jgi:hypothetical protein